LRLRTLVALAASTALISPTAVLAGSTPAVAAEATQVVGSSGKPWIQASSYRTQPGVPKFGDSVYLSINVQTTDGTQVYEGGLTVQQRLASGGSWTTVASSTSAYLYETIKAKGNATYRVLYAGSAAYAPSTSAVAVKVQRDLGTVPVDTGRRLLIKGKVKPRAARKKVVVQRKNGKRWTKFAVVRTNAKSAFTARVQAPAKRGGKIKYRVVMPAGGGFATSTSTTYVATRGY